MSSSGPVNPAVGACATTVLSIDTTIETIQLGKAKVMIADGVDDFTEEMTVEFANMGATSNSVEELARGCMPSEMCRPCTSTRNGFMESHGAGIVTLMSASATIEFGAPIYGIIAMSGTATDKQGQSVPAPGKGVLTSTHESRKSNLFSHLLNFDYCWRQLQHQLSVLKAWKQEELVDLADQASGSTEAVDISMLRCAGEVEKSYRRQRRTSFHGTLTVANDKNKSDVLSTQLKHLDRTPGHVMPVICQKWLTGHPKGPVASFMLNGVIQSLRTGLIPGSYNADNIGKELKINDQVGGELLVVRPDYLLATLTKDQLDEYNGKLERRSAKSERYWQDTLIGNHPFVQVKGHPPFTAEQEKSVYLNPLACAKYDSTSGKLKLQYILSAFFDNQLNASFLKASKVQSFRIWLRRGPVLG
ncbi:fatty acid synthase alpha subunit Lsd1 [Coemansia sp. BCRC 34962]|nr:fatty acid synthase alpha subunit Lsd1 [Coemansia sp. BCRC 34962]